MKKPLTTYRSLALVTQGEIDLSVQTACDELVRRGYNCTDRQNRLVLLEAFAVYLVACNPKLDDEMARVAVERKTLHKRVNK
jgi:hypothetical protein